MNQSETERLEEWAEENPNMTGMPAGSSHWRVTLRCDGRQLTVPYSMGPAHSSEPTAEDVLGCLLSDASSADQDFEQWCSEYGYDTDSRKAERTYQAVVKQAAGVRRLLGDRFETALQCEEPTEETHGWLYATVIGPFRTVRGARFMRDYGRNNPHCQTVQDAERLARFSAHQQADPHCTCNDCMAAFERQIEAKS